MDNIYQNLITSQSSNGWYRVKVLETEIKVRGKEKANRLAELSYKGMTTMHRITTIKNQINSLQTKLQGDINELQNIEQQLHKESKGQLYPEYKTPTPIRRLQSIQSSITDTEGEGLLSDREGEDNYQLEEDGSRLSYSSEENRSSGERNKDLDLEVSEGLKRLRESIADLEVSEGLKRLRESIADLGESTETITNSARDAKKGFDEIGKSIQTLGKSILQSTEHTTKPNYLEPETIDVGSRPID